MKHKAFLLLLLLAPAVLAAKVGVIVTFPDGSVHEQCVSANEEADGFDLLQKLTLDMVWADPSSFGHQLCQINGIGDDVEGSTCSYAGRYWGFFTFDEDWQYMPVGFDAGDGCWNGDLSSYDGHYCAHDKDLIGLRYGEYGEIPAYRSFDGICNPLQFKEVKVYVDGKKENGVDENGGKIDVRPDSKVTFKMEAENNHLSDDIDHVEASLSASSLDIDEEASFKNLGPGDDDERDVDFTIPHLVEDGDYDLELRLSGGDQETTVAYTLNVKKERHNVILEAWMESDEPCIGDRNRLLLKATNLGKDDEALSLSAQNSALGIDFSDSFNLDAGDNRDDVVYERDVPFLVPDTPGKHVINVDLGSEHEDVSLSITDCGVQQEKQETAPVLIQNQATPQAAVQKSTYPEKPFVERNIVPLMLGAFLLIIVALIVLVAVLLKK